MSIELRPITEGEVWTFRSVMGIGFGSDPKPEHDERFSKMMPLERTVAAFDNGDMVGTLGDFELTLTVPGGAQVAMAGTTMVTVLATHTRRGILRSMINQHLDNAIGRGEPVAGLWASESGIYGRFGFGLATENHAVKIDARQLTRPTPAEDLQVSMISPQEIPDVVAPFWSQVARDRAGFIERDEPRWLDIMEDPEHRREGGTGARHIVARRNGEVVGYLDYRQKSRWDDFVANGAVSISALVGGDVDAQLALWAYALNVDLFPNVDFWNGAIDDPLAYEVREARAVRRTTGDALYLRILDLEAALTARTYEQDGEIVFTVEDDMGHAAGTFRLSVDSGKPTVIPAPTAAASVTLGIRELGALYLGRVCADLYATTGHITGSPDAVRTLGQLFATARSPWCPEMF